MIMSTSATKISKEDFIEILLDKKSNKLRYEK